MGQTHIPLEKLKEMGFDNNFEKGIMMGLNFHEEPKCGHLSKEQFLTTRSHKPPIKFPDCPTTPNLR